MKSFITNKVVLKLFVLIFFINQINAQSCPPGSHLEYNVFDPKGSTLCIPDNAMQ
jgi:hypothetical protein